MFALPFQCSFACPRALRVVSWLAEPPSKQRTKPEGRPLVFERIKNCEIPRDFAASFQCEIVKFAYVRFRTQPA